MAKLRLPVTDPTRCVPSDKSCLKKNLKASKPSEHSPNREKVQNVSDVIHVTKAA